MFKNHNQFGSSPRLLLRAWLGLAVLLLLQLGCASAAVTCSLKIEGYGSKQGVKSAQLACTGGSIIAATHPTLLASFSGSFTGVTWSDTGGCGRDRTTCLLTICGASKATFPSAAIMYVNVSSSINLLLCVGDSSSLVFENARFHGNSARPLAADTTYNHIHIKSSRFSNNTVLKAGLEGGALHLNGGTGLVQSSTFVGNRVLFRGGTIGLRNQARLIVESSVFQENEAYEGGAIYAGSTAHLKVQDTVFASNTAAFGGGLLLYFNATGDVVRSNFSNNAVRTTGGAILAADNTTVRITDSSLHNNSARSRAGGLSVWMQAQAGVSNTNFTSNTAGEYGGAACIGSTASLRIKETIFLQNSASRGGAIYAYNDSFLSVRSSGFTSNSASSDGGAVGLWGNATARFEAVVMANNTAKYAGGIDVEENVTLALLTSNVSRNVASKDGGAIYAGGGSRIHLEGCKLTNNSARFGACIEGSDSSFVSITRSALAGNNAQNSGGGLYFEGFANASVLQTHLLQNTAVKGGAMRLVGNSSVVLTDVRLQGNTASGGGAVWLDGRGSLNCTKCRLLHNQAEISGGAVAAIENSTFTVRHCTFESNMAASGGGGALYVGEGSAHGSALEVTGVKNTASKGGFAAVGSFSALSVFNGTFAENAVSSDGRGGLLYVEDKSAVDMRDCRVLGTTLEPGVYGGAFNIRDEARLNLSTCTVAGYSADRGAGIAIYDNSTVHVRDCVWRDLSATRYGGAAFLASNVCSTWRGGKFLDTHAQYGGAVNAVGGRLDVSWLTVYNASASSGGGAFYIEKATVVDLANSRFSSCSSDDSGGALHMTDHGRVTLVNCTITECTAAAAGGALEVTKNATVKMLGCRLQQNEAVTYGGAVSMDGDVHLQAQHSSFVGNVVGEKGGGLFAGGSSALRLEHSVISKNQASSGGGLFLSDDANLSIISTPIVDNTATSYGGGAVLGSDRFQLAALSASLAGNQAPLDANMSALPVGLALVNSSAEHGFISRIRTDEGLWSATLLVTGPRELPSAGMKVVAWLDGAPLANNKSGEDGLVNLHIKLRKPPGAYNISFTMPDADGVNPVLKIVYIVECGIGDTTASTHDACQTCERGSYSLDPRNSTCDLCVPNAECPGGSVILPTLGFWHSSPFSVQMHRCFNQEACPGLSNQQCAHGYTGNLCAVCDTQFGTVRPFTCKKCMRPAAVVTLYTLAAVMLLLAVRVLSALALADSGRPVTAGQPRAVDLTKPLVVYAQWLFIVMSLNGVPWPASLSAPLQALAWFWSSASSNSLGLDCVLPHHSRTPVAVQKVLFGLLMPLAILSVLLSFELLLSVCFRRRRLTLLHSQQRHLSMTDRFLSLSLCMAFLFLPTWTHAVFSLFTCVPLDMAAIPPYEANAVGSFWAQDMSERCYTRSGYHMAWALGLGIPLLLLFCVALPLGLVVWLWLSKRRGRLADDRFRSQYGFLYRTWRDDVCWWEAVVVVQTIVLVMVGTFGYAMGPYFQALVITAALEIILVLLLSVRPHVSAAAGVVSLRSLGVLITTSFSALTFLPYRNISPAPGYTMAMGAFVLFINVLFVITTLWKLLRLVNWAPLCRMAGRCCHTAAPHGYCTCTCWQPEASAGRNGSSMETVPAPMPAPNLPWAAAGPKAAGWCGKEQLQGRAVGSVHACEQAKKSDV